MRVGGAFLFVLICVGKGFLLKFPVRKIVSV